MIENYITGYDSHDTEHVVTNVKIYNLSDAIIGAKYPMSTDVTKVNDDLTKGISALWSSEKGEGHDQSLTGVLLSFDLTLTVKAWTEAERYKFLTFVSSQSTMHRITRFDLPKQYNKYVDERIVDIMVEKVGDYNKYAAYLREHESEMSQDDINKITDLQKHRYLQILYSNPCGFKLTAKMTTNYRQLKTIYAQRKAHRLPEWRDFCAWIETLPYSYLITGKQPTETTEAGPSPSKGV